MGNQYLSASYVENLKLTAKALSYSGNFITGASFGWNLAQFYECKNVNNGIDFATSTIELGAAILGSNPVAVAAGSFSIGKTFQVGLMHMIDILRIHMDEKPLMINYYQFETRFLGCSNND